ncbi:hypothetical protein PIIN_07572 [Serendipita indica DSM 11827]|uniref:DUF6533 domain-containing protein n=1 Tax=Serendipita indica (strain DSM 11827) TaxID=1109443 RepID=G4TQM6_SERID|nr:hypothetical protein PIIN_07572 [Serendipita indica DSM 11827]
MDASTIQSLKTTRYVTLAAFILYIYDWILVIPQEVHLFRLTRSSVGKHLYYAIRIASLCGMSLMMYHTSSFRPDLSQMSCMVFTWIWPSLLLVTMYACYSLLTLRLVALFRSRKPINYTLYGILFSTLLATFVFQIHVQAKYSSVVNNSEIGLCLPPPPPTQDSDLDWNFAYSFFPPLLVEIALTLLTAYRAFYDLRFYLHTRRIALAAKAQNKEGIDRDIEGTRKKRPGQFVALPTVLYRDGATFSLVVITLRVWNLIILMTQPRTSMYMAIVALWTALATLTTRMYLNLCDVIQREPPPSVHPETRQLALLGAATRHQSLMPSRTSTTITGNFPPSAFGYTTRLSEHMVRCLDQVQAAQVPPP